MRPLLALLLLCTACSGKADADPEQEATDSGEGGTGDSAGDTGGDPDTAGDSLRLSGPST